MSATGRHGHDEEVHAQEPQPEAGPSGLPAAVPVAAVQEEQAKGSIEGKEVHEEQQQVAMTGLEPAPEAHQNRHGTAQGTNQGAPQPSASEATATRAQQRDRANPYRSLGACLHVQCSVKRR